MDARMKELGTRQQKELQIMRSLGESSLK